MNEGTMSLTKQVIVTDGKFEWLSGSYHYQEVIVIKCVQLWAIVLNLVMG